MVGFDGFLGAMTWPLGLCLVLGTLLALFGEEVLERRCVFADLAIAQAAGLGAVWGAQLGWSGDDHPWSIRAFALGFTLLAAIVLAARRGLEADLPAEALAGGIYALTAAGTLLVGASLHHGAEQVRDLLAGKLLFVRPATVATAAGLYALIGAALLRFGPRMRPVRVHNRKGTRAVVTPPAPAWDLAFYALLGLAVSYAVPLVGVLLVFAYLLLPAATGRLLGGAGRGARRLRAWLAAVSGTALGLGLAYSSDLPPEPTVVLCLALQLVAAVAVRHLRAARDRLGASVAVASSFTVVLVLLAWTYHLRAAEEVFDPASEPVPSGVQVALVDRLQRQPELWEREREAIEALLLGEDPLVRSRLLELVAGHRDTTLLEPVHTLLRDPDDLVRDAAVHCVSALGRPESVAPLIAAAEAETDDFLRVAIGEALALLGSEAAFEVLLAVMESGEPELVRADAFERLRRHWPAPDTHGPPPPDTEAFDPAADAGTRAAAAERLRRALADAG